MTRGSSKQLHTTLRAFAGWEGRVRHDGRTFEEAEPELKVDYDLTKSELDPD